jgi:beta-1,4-N-acetylglucosaminyltransferase
VILVTVGLHDRPFDRLVRAADGMASLTTEPVIIQRGCTRYRPLHAAWFGAVPASRMAALVAQARVVVSHAGAGSVLSAQRARVPLVLVPRLCRWGESIDDHQQQLAAALAQQGRAAVLDEVSPMALYCAAAQARPSTDAMPGIALQQALRDWLDEAAARTGPWRWTRRGA